MARQQDNAPARPDTAALLQAHLQRTTGETCKRIDTHAATIILCGDRAWKVKRPVRLPYLDFSRPEARRTALEAELNLNRRTAPDLYLAVHAMTRTATGTLNLDRDDEADDWVLEMKRFPDNALLADHVGRGDLDDRLILGLADRIAAFHAAAEPCATANGADRLRAVVAGNLVSMRACTEILDQTSAVLLTAAQFARIDLFAALLDERAGEGRIKRCHGDLHLANIAVIDGEAVPFDCLEFDDDLATSDILYDLAFLLMDLWERSAWHHANLLFNRYLDLSGDEQGGPLLPLMMSIRATVRAHVAATQAEAGGRPDKEQEARRYFDLATHLLETVPSRLVAIGGFSGTGKSTIARAIGHLIGGAPGARILRSDVLRKRLAGFPPEHRLDASAYSPAASAQVYRHLADLSRRALDGQRSVVADAVFGTLEERETIELAAGANRFSGLWLELSEEGRIARIAKRGPDASDADAAVAARQSRSLAAEPIGWPIVETSGDMSETIMRIRRLLGLSSRP